MRDGIPQGRHGKSHVHMAQLNAVLVRNGGEVYFPPPKDQSARLLWYHDHAPGITRLNVYAGRSLPYQANPGRAYADPEGAKIRRLTLHSMRHLTPPVFCITY